MANLMMMAKAPHQPLRPASVTHRTPAHCTTRVRNRYAGTRIDLPHQLADKMISSHRPPPQCACVPSLAGLDAAQRYDESITHLEKKPHVHQQALNHAAQQARIHTLNRYGITTYDFGTRYLQQGCVGLCTAAVCHSVASTTHRGRRRPAAKLPPRRGHHAW